MGWGNCGTDKRGRPIGYCHAGKCDHPGCDELIDRGLAYACGGMHGEDEYSCDQYFCAQHRSVVEFNDGSVKEICLKCEEVMAREGVLVDEETA